MLARCLSAGCLTVIWAFGTVAAQAADTYYLADGQAWPGRLLAWHDETAAPFFVRSEALPAEDQPKLRSVTALPDGGWAYCSGVDRSIYVLHDGEERLHYGGWLVRQVRLGGDGRLYWSGLETPLDNNPLPDGFICSLDLATREVRTELTFSQLDVNRDWWGAFDIHDGQVIVGTLHEATSLYNVSVSPPQLLATLPLGAKSFRFAADGSLWACDGQGRLLRFVDLRRPEQGELVLQSDVPFTDFAWTVGE